MPNTVRPRTVEEFDALPIGPAFGMSIEVIDGSEVRRPIAPEMVVFWSEDSDLLGYVDDDGERWQLGLYSDGRWFRMRSG